MENSNKDPNAGLGHVVLHSVVNVLDDVSIIAVDACDVAHVEVALEAGTARKWLLAVVKLAFTSSPTISLRPSGTTQNDFFAFFAARGASVADSAVVVALPAALLPEDFAAAALAHFGATAGAAAPAGALRAFL
eukprot:6180149-Pleurochrysis_carterae.AAC.2